MKKGFAVLISAALLLGVLAGCGQAAASAPQPVPVASAPAEPVVSSEAQPAEGAPRTTFRIAGMKGPTTMGMVQLMQQVDEGVARHDYGVEIYGAAPEINNKLITGEIDVAALPANVASVLYNATEGLIQVAAINTLGVLYLVENGTEINSVQDLAGKTIYSTGKGQTPEFVLNYLLRQNGIDPETDVTIEYKSEATEVGALLAGGGEGIAVLPQPYVTAVQLQNENVRIALDLTKEWDVVSADSALVTGVLVARTEFIEQNPVAFAEFLQDYAASIDWVNANTEQAAGIITQYGIVEQVPVAQKALPLCNITYIDGAEMEELLGGYLQVLYDQLPEAVGGSMPGEAFYYKG